MDKKPIISLSAMEKLMREAGAPRVSEEAKDTLREVLEEMGLKISKEALELSEHANRRTIKARDIRLATKNK